VVVHVTHTEWERRRRTPGRVLAVLALGLLALGGCESDFVDPHPPELERLQRQQSVGVQDVPVVYGLLFDLNLPDASECARIKARLTSTLRAALLPAGRQGLELTAQELSPGCQQPTSRSVDLNLYAQGVRDAERRFGTGRIRPVLFYFNNVNLRLPLQLQRDLETLRNWSTGPALVWAVTTPETQQGLFDQSMPWTYSADPGLPTHLENLTQAQLPLVQLEVPPAQGYPLFTPEELRSVREFKGCTSPPNLKGANFTFGFKTVTVDPANPPRIQLTGAVQQPPVPRTQKLTPLTVRFTLEVCRANCDRLYPVPPSGVLEVWNTQPSCVLGAASP